VGKITLGIQGDKNPEKSLKKFSGHVFLDDIIKAQIEGCGGLVADSIDYRDFLKLKNNGEDFYLEVSRFGE